MKKDFQWSILTDRTPKEVFNAIREVRTWWTGYHKEEFSGDTKNLNDEFSFVAENGLHCSTQKIVELVPDEKMVWLVTDSFLGFVEQSDEWIGSKIIFEIAKVGTKTELRFTHQGLTPEVECYDSCAPSWTTYLKNKLVPLIESGGITST